MILSVWSEIMTGSFFKRRGSQVKTINEIVKMVNEIELCRASTQCVCFGVMKFAWELKESKEQCDIKSTSKKWHLKSEIHTM